MHFFFLFFFFFLTNSSEDLFIRGIGYKTLTSKEKKSIVLRTSFFGKTIFAVSSKSNNVKLFISQTNEVLPNYFIANPNTEVEIEFPESESMIAFGYAELYGTSCDATFVSTKDNDSFTYVLNQSSNACFLYAPNGDYLQYNVMKASMNTKYDSLTIYQGSTNNPWYDRYETIQNPTGWSAISNSPWFFILKGSDKSEVSIELRCLLNENVNNLMYQNQVNTLKATEISKTSLNIGIPIVGCLAPTLLLVSWIFAFWRLNKKDVN